MVSTSTDQSYDEWDVNFHDDFIPEFNGMDMDVRRGLWAATLALERSGPKTGRPHVDTLHGSRHANMKELRFKAKSGNEIWRAAFAFDPLRCACLLVAGAKQGKSESEFYRQLIRVADERFDDHLAKLMNEMTTTSTRS
jgi:hypothetical protein